MNFRIADTFTDSFAKLTGEEQKEVWADFAVKVINHLGDEVMKVFHA